MINVAENNGMWKGDKVSYGALHDYVKYHLPKPEKCQNCGAKKKLDLANKSGEYKRNLSDWEWLCRLCHMIKDGRVNNLPNYNRGRKLPERTKQKIASAVKKLGLIPPSALGKTRSEATKNKMAVARKQWWDRYYKGEVTSKRYKNL